MPRLLVVEDEATIANMYRFKLEQAGHTVQCADNGEEGLIKAEEFKPELILLDLRMPEKDGAEMLADLRASDWGYDIPVIILTNISKNEAPAGLRFLRVERYIVKAHHTPSQVLSVVEEVLRKVASPAK